MRRNSTFLVITWTVALLALPDTAAAYLDPGTGSIMLQGLIALVGAIIATVGIYWRAVKDFILRGLGRKSEPKSDRTNSS